MTIGGNFFASESFNIFRIEVLWGAYYKILGINPYLLVFRFKGTNDDLGAKTTWVWKVNFEETGFESYTYHIVLTIVLYIVIFFTIDASS